MLGSIGKYQIEAEIGRGGFGRVYRAFDPSVGRTVAIKVLTVGSDPEVLERFRREAAAAGNLRHKNILTIYDVGEHEGLPYIVMEHVEGQDLQQVIRGGRPIEMPEKISILTQIADGLRYAHQNGVVHRDIKPSNIMLEADGTAKIMDFGIARRLADESGSLTRSGSLLGTAQYMAPEQVAGRPAEASADIWAFGVIGYELLTRKHPFGAPDVRVTMLNILQADVAPVRSLAPDCPEALEHVIQRCLAKEPGERYQTLEDVRVDLEPVLVDARRARVASVVEGARQLLESGNITQALAAVRQGLELDPANAEARSLRDSIQAAGVERGARRPSATATWAASAGQPVDRTLAAAPASAAPRARTHRYIRLLAAAAALAVLFTCGALWVSGLAAAFAFVAAILAVAGGAAYLAYRLVSWPSARKSAAASVEAGPVASAPDDRTVIERRPVAELFSADLASAAAAFAGPHPADVTCLVTPSALPFPRVHLVVTSSADPFMVGRSVNITKVPFLIGRSAPDLPITSDAALSREHAAIGWDGGAFTLSDLDSSNGTYLNGMRVPPRVPEPLLFGAVIRLSGSTVLTLASDDVLELPDLTGQVIDHRFTLTRLIRTSAKAAIYEARDSRLPHSIAIKLLSPSLARYPGYLERFNQEAETAARLRHPHISKILDHGQALLSLGGESVTIHYVCMELMEGGNLADRLAQHRHVAAEQVAAWLDDLSAALDYAHQQGVIHGGLKPAAIVFDGSDSVYVTDFAIAGRPGGARKQALLGAPDFLAPEQWEGQDATAASDQYALAVLTYLALTGSRPYEGQQDHEVRRKNYERGPVPAHEQAARSGVENLPASVTEVLNCALSVAPEERYPSVREFYLAFHSALANPGGRRAGAPRVFVSYRRDLSAGWAVLFARELQDKHNISAFVDTQRMDSAVRIPAKIQQAIQDCDIFVCLLAKDTLGSAWVQEEVRIASESGKPMIPVFQESFDVPGSADPLAPHIQSLISYEAVHLLDRRNIHVDHTIAELARLVNESTRRERRSAAGGGRARG